MIVVARDLGTVTADVVVLDHAVEVIRAIRTPVAVARHHTQNPSPDPDRPASHLVAEFRAHRARFVDHAAEVEIKKGKHSRFGRFELKKQSTNLFQTHFCNFTIIFLFFLYFDGFCIFAEAN